MSLWDKKDVAEHLKVSEETISKMIQKRKIPFIKLTRKLIRFDPEEIRTWKSTFKIEPIRQEVL